MPTGFAAPRARLSPDRSVETQGPTRVDNSIAGRVNGVGDLPRHITRGRSIGRTAHRTRARAEPGRLRASHLFLDSDLTSQGALRSQKIDDDGIICDRHRAALHIPRAAWQALAAAPQASASGPRSQVDGEIQRVTKTRRTRAARGCLHDASRPMVSASVTVRCIAGVGARVSGCPAQARFVTAAYRAPPGACRVRASTQILAKTAV
jgi:hypothetical protein